MQNEPFDFTRAAFYLVAGVIAAHVLVVFVGIAVCVWEIDAIIAGKYHCDAEAKLTEVLAAALAAALGFAGGRMSK